MIKRIWAGLTGYRTYTASWFLILVGVARLLHKPLLDDGLFQATVLFDILFVLIGCAMMFLRMSIGTNRKMLADVSRQNTQIIAMLRNMNGMGDGK